MVSPPSLQGSGGCKQIWISEREVGHLFPTADSSTEADTGMTLLANDKISASAASGRIFRPWTGDVEDILEPGQGTEAKKCTMATGSHRRDAKAKTRRKEKVLPPPERPSTLDTSPMFTHQLPQSSVAPMHFPHSMMPFQCPGLPQGFPLMPDVMASTSAATTTDGLPELSRADLETLGLMCPSDYVRMKARRQRPKKYRCPHCQVAFSNNGQLKGHVRIHTGERPFKCDHETCGKSFTRNEELTRHKRIHSGLRPFPCQMCGKRFGRKDHLKKHTRTHQKVPLLPIHVPMIPVHGFPYLYGF